MKQPREITDLISFLKAQGFSLCRNEGPDANHFGYTVMEYSNGSVNVRLELERLGWLVTMADVAQPDDWYGIILLRDLIRGVGPPDELSVAEQVSILKTVWRDVMDAFSPARSEATHAQLGQLADAFASRVLPDLVWPDAVLILESFLIDRGLTCVRREAPEGTKGARGMLYADDVISVRLTYGGPRTSECWRVKVADSARPETWYDISLIRSLFDRANDLTTRFSDLREFVRRKWAKVKMMNDRELGHAPSFQFARAYWSSIRRLFAAKRREATHARLQEMMQEKTGT